MDLNQHYAALREKNRRLTQKRREECLQKCPELAMVMAQKAKAFLLPAGEALTALAKLKQHQKSLLKAMDLPDTYLDPIYDCPLCRDTGYVGSPVQKKPFLSPVDTGRAAGTWQKLFRQRYSVSGFGTGRRKLADHRVFLYSGYYEWPERTHQLPEHLYERTFSGSGRSGQRAYDTQYNGGIYLCPVR